MAFLTTLLLYAGAFLLTELLRPKPDVEDARPANLGDFNFPTATEGRSVPLIWGTVRLKGPNVVWYGDLQQDPIKQSVKTGLFSSDKQTIGFEYRVGLQMALCRGPGTVLRRIWIKNKVAFDGTLTGEQTTTLDDPKFFGGRDLGNGGIEGDITFYEGTTAQAADSYLAAFQTPTPAYRPICYLVAKSFYVGNSARVDPWEFELQRLPDPLDLATEQPGDELVNGFDCNPMNVAYEIMTDPDWGLAIPTSDVDLVTFRAAAATLATEGNGMSWTHDRQRPAADLLQEVERQIDGVIYLDRTTGLFKAELARTESNPASLPAFDQTNVRDMASYARPSWEETTNEVRVNFSSRNKDYTETFASAQDMANVRIQGRVVHTEPRYPACKDSTLANQLAWRDLQGLSFPAAKLKIITNRDGRALFPGAAFRLSWGALDLVDVVFRVTKINYGELTQGRITVEAVEDIFNTGQTAFSDPIDTGWDRPSQDALAALNETLYETPYALKSPDPDLNTPSTLREVSVLAGRPSGTHLQYEVWADPAGGTAYELADTVDVWTPVATLDSNLDRGETNGFIDAVGFTVTNVEGLEDITDATAAERAALKNVLFVDNEIMLFDNITDQGAGVYLLQNVRRGALDTVPASHTAGAVVRFASYGFGNATPTGLPADGTVQAEILTETLFDKLTFAEAATLSVTTDSRAAKAYPARDVQINSSRASGGNFPTETTAGPLEITWKRSNKLSQSPDTAQTDADIEQEGSSGFNVRVIERSGFTTVAEVIAVPVNAFNAQGFADDALTDEYRLEIESTNSAGESQVWQHDFLLTGYGYDYGENYGGESTGTLLAQGDPPALVEPIPGLDTENRLVLTASGTVSSDTYYFNISFTDDTTGDTEQRLYTVTNAGKAQPVDYLSELAGNIQTDFPAGRVTTSIVGSTLTVASVYGRLGGEVWNNSAAIKVVREQDQQGVTGGRAAASNFDLWVLNAGNEDESPSLSSAYGSGGNISGRFTVAALTYDTKKALNGIRVYGSQEFSLLGLVPDAGGAFLSYTAALSQPSTNNGLLENLRASVGGSLGDFVESVNLTRNPDDQFDPSRIGIRVRMKPNFIIVEQNFSTTPNNCPSAMTAAGMKLLAKTTVAGVASFPDGAQQIDTVTFTTTYASNGAAYQSLNTAHVYTITLDGTTYSYNMTSADTADPPYRDGVYADLADQIQDTGNYTVEFNTLSRGAGTRPPGILDPGSLLPPSGEFVSGMVIRSVGVLSGYEVSATADRGTIITATTETVDL